MNDLGITARVAYSSRFLRSIAEPVNSVRWNDRGIIFKIDDGWLATVWWQSGTLNTINLDNLRSVDHLNEETPWPHTGFMKNNS